MTPGANPYLDHYIAEREHQREHLGLLGGRPHEICIACLTNGQRPSDEFHGVKQRYAWAIPSVAALDAIAEHSPGGVIEIGAGAGYWAAMLRARGVDVIAYDPAPPGHDSNWHAGHEWSEVKLGDHRVISEHPNRTLLLVWPSYGESWTDEVVELYGGQTIAYVGEGAMGCTGTDRMHALLGDDDTCWCFDECECPPSPKTLFRETATVDIPQWAGVNDRLSIYTRR